MQKDDTGHGELLESDGQRTQRSSNSVYESTSLLASEPQGSDRIIVVPEPIPVSPTTSLTERIVSLDQFRGYTVFLSVFITFLGGFTVMPDVFRHNKVWFSLADAIMPQFFMAVGFGYRLTALKAR